MENVIINGTGYSFNVSGLEFQSNVNPHEHLSLDEFIEQQNILQSNITADELLAFI